MQLSRLTYPPLHQVGISPCKLHCYRLPAYGRCTSLILAMPGSLDMNKATRNVELLGVPYAAFPTDTPPPGLLRPFTNRVFTGDAQSQPPEVTAGIKMADTQSCTYWFSAAVGRLSFSQVRSEIQLMSFYLFMRFWYRRTPF